MASKLYEYVLQLQDRVSAQLAQLAQTENKVEASTKRLTDGIGKLDAANKKAAESTGRFGTSSKQAADGVDKLGKETKETASQSELLAKALEQAKRKVDDLRTMRELLPREATESIRSLNKQLAEAEQRMMRVASSGGGGRTGGGLRGAVSGMFGGGQFGNLMAGALPMMSAGAALTTVYSGVSRSVNEALSYEQAMAKLNATALLKPGDLKLLGADIKNMANSYGVLPTKAMMGYESAISITNDMGKSRQLLELAMQANKASGTPDAELTPVVRALGYLNTQMPDAKPADILDTLLASKRAGGIELEDAARYASRLQAQGSTMQIPFRENMATFSAFTSLGSAEDAYVMQSNLLTALSKKDIREGINKVTPVFDKSGTMLPLNQIMAGLAKAMQQMSPETRMNFTENVMELRDVQAKQAFGMMISNADKFAKVLEEVSSSTGELDKQMRAVSDVSQATEAVKRFDSAVSAMSAQIGEVFMPALARMAENAASLITGKRPEAVGKERELREAVAAGRGGELLKQLDKEEESYFKNQSIGQRAGAFFKGTFMPWSADAATKRMLGGNTDEGSLAYERNQVKAMMANPDAELRAAMAKSNLAAYYKANPGAKDLMERQSNQLLGMVGGQAQQSFKGLLPSAELPAQEFGQLKELSTMTQEGGPRAVTVSMNMNGPLMNVEGITLLQGEQQQKVEELTDQIAEVMLRKIRGMQLTASAG